MAFWHVSPPLEMFFTLLYQWLTLAPGVSTAPKYFCGRVGDLAVSQKRAQAQGQGGLTAPCAVGAQAGSFSAWWDVNGS